MKIGICTTDAERIKQAHSIGYDFVEVNNTRINSMSDEEFNSLLDLKKTCRNGFFYAANGLVPSEIRLTGPDVDYDKIRAFSAKSFARLSLLGIRVIVFGSSKSKEVPGGFSFDEAMKQLVEVTRIFAEEASKYEISVCIEPLNCSECNIINTAEEAIALADAANMPNVYGHVDYYHMMQNGERMSSLLPLASRIIHAHIASPIKRAVVAYDDGADYFSFFKFLREGGYDKTVSYEGKGIYDEKILGDMLEYLRSL